MGAREAEGVDGPSGGVEPGEVFSGFGEGASGLGVVADQFEGSVGVDGQAQLLHDLLGVQYLGVGFVH